MRKQLLAFLVLGGAAIGCGAAIPPPTNQWAAAQTDLGRAESAGAANVPEAKLHLELALEDLAMAQRLMGHDNERATTLTQLGRAEARLASSLAAESVAQDDARKAATEMQGGQR
jgi:hypothetical protein